MTMVLNVIALWKQEARDPAHDVARADQPTFHEPGGIQRRRRRSGVWSRSASAPSPSACRTSCSSPMAARFCTCRRNHDDLTLLLAPAASSASASRLAAGPRRRRLSLGGIRRAGRTGGLQPVIFAAPSARVALFAIGVALIGFGAGLFAHCTLTAAMGTARAGQIGLALGVWGAVQASAAGSGRRWGA